MAGALNDLWVNALVPKVFSRFLGKFVAMTIGALRNCDDGHGGIPYKLDRRAITSDPFSRAELKSCAKPQQGYVSEIISFYMPAQ